MSDTQVMVSIKCLVYNHEKYLRKALDGFLMQKTNFKFEVIIHDDASTDNSAEIIREYEEKHPDIFKPIYQTENQYRRTNINKVFVDPRLTGKYIAYCEGDDYWTDPNKLQMQVDYLEAHPECSFTFHNATIVWENGEVFKKQFLPEDTFKSPLWENRDRAYNAGELILLGFIPTASIVGRAEYVLGRRDFCEKPICGDLPLRLSMSLDGYGYYFNKIMSVYRTGNSHSASGQASKTTDAQMRTFAGHKAILEGFNEYTGGKWQKEVEYDLRRRKLRTYMNTANHQAIKAEGLRKMLYTDTTLMFRIKYYARLRCGRFYLWLKLMRNRIKGY